MNNWNVGLGGENISSQIKSASDTFHCRNFPKIQCARQKCRSFSSKLKIPSNQFQLHGACCCQHFDMSIPDALLELNQFICKRHLSHSHRANQFVHYPKRKVFFEANLPFLFLSLSLFSKFMANNQIMEWR